MSEETMENIINDAFMRVQEAYARRGDAAGRSTLLVFPIHHVQHNGKLYVRMCEQELRFAFVEAFNEAFRGTNLSYSVETPTIDRYLFSVSKTSTEHGLNDQLPCISPYGEPGFFDLVIYEGHDVACLIEFKARNPVPEKYAKDLLKLSNPIEDGKEGTGAPLRYFIQMVESYDHLTIQSIKGKLKELSEQSKYTQGKKPVRCICYSLARRHSGEQQGKRIIDLTFPLRD